MFSRARRAAAAAAAAGAAAFSASWVASCDGPARAWGMSSSGPRRPPKLFSGNGNARLAQEIADTLGIDLSLIRVGRFADGEVDIQVLDNVRGEDVFIIQPTCAPVNDNLIELLLMGEPCTSCFLPPSLALATSS